MQRLACFLLCLIPVACTKDGEQVYLHGVPAPISINEVQATDPHCGNALDGTGDWIELHNSGVPYRLEAGEWYLTNDRTDLMLSELPGIDLGEQEAVRIWCNGQDGDPGAVHVPFTLADEGGWIALVHVRNGGILIIDTVQYPPQDARNGLTTGRYPDGSQAWMPLAFPTPGAPNEGPAYPP